jgi:hypothetical protein
VHSSQSEGARRTCCTVDTANGSKTLEVILGKQGKQKRKEKMLENIKCEFEVICLRE